MEVRGKECSEQENKLALSRSMASVSSGRAEKMAQMLVGGKYGGGSKELSSN